MKDNLQPDIFNRNYPIVGIDLLPGGVVVRRQGDSKNNTSPLTPKRGKVGYLSRRSLSKLAFLAQVTSVVFTSMITLTYGLSYPTTGKRLKRDLNSLLVQTRRGFGWYEYLWFLEFQQRGAPHIHLLTTLDPPEPNDRIDLARIWTRIALDGDERPYSQLRDRKLVEGANLMRKVHQHPKTWEPIRVEDGARRYVIKYATKTHQKVVPAEFGDVGRFWASSRAVKVNDEDTLAFRCDEKQLRQLLFLVGRDDLLKQEVLPKYIFLPKDLYTRMAKRVKKEG